jgi:dipeptidyl aminopeptidase/acylaminoacyl peptidase
VFASQIRAHQTSALNGSSLYDVREIENPKGPLVLTNETPPQWTLSGLFRVGGFGDIEFVDGKINREVLSRMPAPRMINQLFVADIDGKRVIQLTRDDGIYFNPAWSPDGRSIVCASAEAQSLAGGGPNTTNIYAVDLSSGKKQVLTRGAGQKNLPSWSPDGKWIAYLSKEGVFGRQSVLLIPSTGGAAKSLSPDLDRSIISFAWYPDSHSIVVVYRDGLTSPIARIDIRTGRVQYVSGTELASRDKATVSQTGTIAWQQEDEATFGVIHVLPPSGQSSDILVNLNPQLLRWKLGVQEVIRWQNGRGDEMEGILLKPVDYRPNHKYPLIVDAYPDQVAAFRGWALGGNQAWASKGYAVFWPSARAPHDWMNWFKSKEYDQAAKGPKGWDITVDDVMSGVDELIHRGIVDPGRIGLFGFSNGAAIVDQLVTRTNRFKCAVSVAASLSIDWSLPFFLWTMDPLVPQVSGVTPWQDPESYIELSAIYRLDKVNTPMLLADGDNDGSFLLESIEMYNGLRYLGKDVVFLRYPGQGHGFRGDAMRDFWERETSFFAKFLGEAN